MIKGILTAERAKDIITAAFPRFRGTKVELLGEGWDFQVFEVDAGWLFRFPKREKSAIKLSLECSLLSFPGHAIWRLVSQFIISHWVKTLVAPNGSMPGKRHYG